MKEVSRGLTLVSLLLALLTGCGVAVYAQAPLPTTTVADTVYNASGVPASGTVLVSWSAFTAASGASIPAGSTSATIGVNGALSISLAPNAGATPIGSYYTATFHLSDGTTSRQYWVVPQTVAGGGVAKLSAIQNSVLPTSVAMQTVSKANAKDTFYEMLRGRLAAINPERTVTVRGVTRPAVLVEENELATAFHLPGCFRLRWAAASVDAKGAMPLVTMQCSIDYETAGTGTNAGMDRGRLLAAMDGELLAALNMQPQHTQKYNYAPLVDGKTASALNTQVWWSEPAFGTVEAKRDRIARTATLAVMSYEEGGEL